MAASHEMVAHDVQRIAGIARQFASSTVVLETNKRSVIWCPDRVCARNVAFRINNAGYAVEVRKGLATDAYYVQAWL